MNNSKCILPWIHLQVDSDGSVRPCCNSVKGGPPLGNILKDSPITVWNNDSYRKLRSDMIAGIEPDDCRTCYESERLGLYSKRQRETDEWEQYAPLMNSEVAEFKIRHLDVRFDNVCNFKCRYCSAWLSHSWVQDYKKLNWPVVLETAINVNGPSLFNIIKDNIVDDLEHVFFCGGEPLLMDEHLALLKLLDAKGKHNVRLMYITNLSRLSFKGTNYIELWDKFEDVNIHFSLDCIGSKLEYIRCGAKWAEIEQNVKTVFAHKAKLKPKISITVSMFNADTVIDTVEHLVGTGYIDYDDITIHVVKNPRVYSSQILPKEIKQRITARVNEFLSKHELPMFFRTRYEYFINYMNDVDAYEQHKEEFIKLTKQLDNVREEDFASTFPELSGYYD